MSIAVMLAVFASFILTVGFTPQFINYAHKKHQGQMIREEGPKWHEKKSGTPTMGGLVFNAVIIVVSLVASWCAKVLTPMGIVINFILFLYGCLGMWDDSIKLFKRQNEGLKAWQKATGQVVGAIIFMLVYHHEHLPNVLHVMQVHIPLGIIVFSLFTIFWLTGFSNAVNLTDGIDGLVAGQASIAFGAYAIIAWRQQQFDVFIFCLTTIGALLGFFIFNHKPARIFMGDMGSLALGGALAAVSIAVHHELSLLLIGIIFVCETLSVIIQVGSFKLTGKRVFKMSPIHHHFEMCGWSEWRIDVTFWLIGLVAALIAVMFI